MTWPHAKHRLVNRALMATGPSGFDGCLNRFVPLEADVALLGFADVSELHQQRSGLSRAVCHVQSQSSTAHSAQRARTTQKQRAEALTETLAQRRTSQSDHMCLCMQGTPSLPLHSSHSIPPTHHPTHHPSHPHRSATPPPSLCTTPLLASLWRGSCASWLPEPILPPSYSSTSTRRACAISPYLPHACNRPCNLPASPHHAFD